VARASLSRTLRRLWRAGWVELVNAWGTSLTERHAAAAPGLMLYATPEAYLVYLRERAARLTHGRPVHLVQIMDAGRERLTAPQWEVNRNAKRDSLTSLSVTRPGISSQGSKYSPQSKGTAE
jgi:hypothetical protein